MTDRFGAKLADEVFANQKRLSARQVYPDEAFTSLHARAAELSQREPEGLLREFGAAMVGIFYETYPSYFPPEGAKRFLLGLDMIVHARIRDLLPGAEPPRLELADLGDGRIKLVYHSERRLCSLVGGMLDGVGWHYQTPVRHYEQTCVRKGEPECTFLIEVQQTLLPRAKTRPR